MRRLLPVLPLLVACGGMPPSAASASSTASPPDDAGEAGGAAGAAAVALRELAQLNLQATGAPRTFDTVLPPVLDDANYGLKARACSGGGYDLGSVAGRAVTFVGYGTTCAGEARDAWVVVHGAAAACAYLAEPEGSAGAPGVHAVTGCE